MSAAPSDADWPRGVAVGGAVALVVGACGAFCLLAVGAASVSTTLPPPAPLSLADPGGPLGPREGRVAWRFATGGPVSGAAAVDGEGRVYVSSHDGHLYALSSDGALRWRRALGAAAYAGPLLADGRLYVGTDAGDLCAFDTDGRELFRVRLPAPVERSPVDGLGGLVLCAAGRELWALTRDGAQVFRFAAHRKIFGGPVADAEHVVFGAQDHRLYVLDRGGRPRASVDLGADVDAAPLLAPDGTVFAGADDGRLHAVTLDGELRWSHALAAPLRAPPALAPGGLLLAVAHGVNPALHVLDRTTGLLQARVSLGLTDSPAYALQAGPVLSAGPTVYLAAPGPRLLALDGAGRTRFSVALDGELDATPVLAGDGTLYVAARDGVVYAVRD